MRRCQDWMLLSIAASSLLMAGGCMAEVQTTAATSSRKEASVSKFSYPETRRVDQVDEYHGVKVADPYRWLEADVRESPEVAAWVKQQNEIARKFLDSIPQRPAIENRLTELWNYERYSTPTQEGGKYFYLKNDGLQNQPVLYVADSYSAEGRVLVDPNEWSEDGTIALSSFSPSEDGRYVAYGRSEAGSDWRQVYVLGDPPAGPTRTRCRRRGATRETPRPPERPCRLPAPGISTPIPSGRR